jgi:riboflavin synthase
MFTGIIEEKGIVRRVYTGMDHDARIGISTTFKNISIGESIAVDGVCLSVISYESSEIEFDLSPETLKRTTIGNLSTGSMVNLERAMKADGRFSGHIVQGHADCVAVVKSIVSQAKMKEVTFELPVKSLFLLEKGSVAVNGVSLTVNRVSGRLFSVMLIPITLENTNLRTLIKGSQVNIEFDIIAKYLANLVKKQDSAVDEDFLKKHGFF